MPSPKPLLLLDVDGPLSPFRQLTSKSFLPPKVRGNGRAFEWELHWTYPVGWEEKGLRVLLSRDHGEEFRRLQAYYTLVWATTWGHEANTWIGPRVGLPKLPVIEFPSDGTEHEWKRTTNHRGSWKTKYVAKWLDEYGWYKASDGEVRRLPWVFVDDEVNRFDNAWLMDHWNEPDKAHPVAPRWLLRVEPTMGLASSDFKALAKWGQAHQLA